MQPRAPIVAIAFAVCLAAGGLSAAQTVPLDSAIADLRAGDPLRGLAGLNDVVAKLSGPGGDPAQLGRAHAYRALAYLMMNQPERARAAAAVALAADPAISIGPPDFTPDAVRLFDMLRAPAPADPEAAAAAAESAGRYDDAFLQLLTAYQALPNPAPAADDRRLREKIINVVGKLSRAPAIPADARGHFDKATALIEAEAVLGGTGGASSQSAAAELQLALRSAPWWPEATFKLATVLQKLQRVDDALINLQLYKAADPKGYAASIEKANPGRPAPAAASAPAAPVPAALAPGTIVIYRPGNFMGSMARMKIQCNGVKVADLQNGRMITLKAPPGSYDIKVHNKDATVLVEPGGEYYYRAGPAAMGISLRRMAGDEAKVDFKERNIKPNDKNRVYFEECKQ